MSENEQFRSSWLLRSATVVAIQTDGVAVVEDGLTLRVLDGRSEYIHPGADGGLGTSRTALIYEMSIYVEGPGDFYESKLHDAEIVISGGLEDGSPLKLWGRGYVGHDNLGRIECTFSAPPRIELVEAAEPFLAVRSDDLV